MRIGLLTDGGHPYATGESRLWCDRLVRGLAQHEFDICALSRSAWREERGWTEPPRRIQRVRTAPLRAPADDGRGHGRRDRRRFAEHFGRLVAAVCSDGPEGGPGSGPRDGSGDGSRDGSAERADGFAAGLHGLADLAGERGGLHRGLRSEAAVRLVESACRAPGARRSVRFATVPDLLAFADRLERALRPLSLDWYDDATPGAVDLCHAASGGSAALPGLLAKRFFGVPLVVTEYGVQLRAHYLATGAAASAAGGAGGGAGGAPAGAAPLGTPVRALPAAFRRRPAAEIYRQADVITPGNAHAGRWQEWCGADRAKLRTVHPGMEAERFSGAVPAGSRGGFSAGAAAGAGDGGPGTLVWVGRIEPAKDLVPLLHAFAAVRAAEPGARRDTVKHSNTMKETPDMTPPSPAPAFAKARRHGRAPR